MPMNYSATPQALGYAFNTPHTGYNVRQQHLVHSVSNGRRKGAYTSGGGFLVVKRENIFTTALLPSYTYGGNQHGGLAAPVGYIGSPPAGPASDPSYSSEASSMNGWGAKGWARARPGNPVANAGQFLGELRQLPQVPLLGRPSEGVLKGSLKGLPGRMLRRLATFRALGSEYLNAQFGWVPFVKDLQGMYELTLDIDKRLDRLRRDNGQSLYRRRVLQDSTSSTSTVSSVNGPFGYLMPTPIIYGGGRSVRTQIVSSSEKIWFVGRFQYYVPNIGTLEWKKRATRALYGGNLTPSLAWELMPWSWLNDWFNSAGDVFSNMSQNAVDNTVAKYAYIMRTSTEETNVTVQTTWGKGHGAFGGYLAGSAMATHVVRRELKMRSNASPFGFGMTFGGLSGYQASILGALGMSRSRF